MWDKFKELWSSLLLVCALGWILFHLIMIKKHGVVAIKEDNKLILNVELVFTSLLVFLGVERFIKGVTDE